MPSRSKATPQLPRGPTALYPAPAHVPGQPLASPGGEVSPSWPLSSPSRLPAGPAHPNCSRYRRLRGCDTLRGRGPETDMLGQQLPCSITVPAEGRDLGRSQWHFSSHQWLPSPAWLLLTPRSCCWAPAPCNPESSPVTATHGCIQTAHPLRGHWKAVEKYSRRNACFSPKCS